MVGEKSSRMSGFYRLEMEERLNKVADFSGLSEEEKNLFLKNGELSLAIDKSIADRMIENVIGIFELPLGIATNFRINGKDYLIPMAIEETSVVAAASNAARIARVRGGFTAWASEPLMIGQIQVLRIKDREGALRSIQENKVKILELANAQDKVLVNLGGGAKDIEVRFLDDMMVLHLLVDVRDAMGANVVNTMCEAVAPMIEELTGGKVRLRIVSNLADKRLAGARAVFDKDVMGGEDVVNAFLEGYRFATLDPYRAATHNKGIMNGIDAVVIATGNDWRAIEAGAHSYAARTGKYQPLTKYWKDEDGNLVGEIELPVAIGTVGGASSLHRRAQICKKILGVKSAKELAEIIASVGLAQNFAALLALSTVGIQKGHMELHAQNIAVMAGAKGEQIDVIAQRMIEEGKIRLDRAKELMKELYG
ncbi:MAG: hydroxymethylglutaryl-CoA reductase, degradative [Thermoplasmata archaeon]|nr:MAG: hydroxymethylglutaryl-CoA reductase, degradative [Thermoplasmata archaeon]